MGVAAAEAFWWRVYVEALRRGLGTPAVRTVIVLGDGAEWIWHRAAAFLGVAGVEVVEIVDIYHYHYHAYEYLWAVGNVLYGAGRPCAVAGVEPLKDQLYGHGAAPVLRALAALTPTTAEASAAVADAQSYFTTQAARMDDPRFVARQFPIGSGAGESSCKGVVAARLKQAGMRWATAGSQAIVRLRALHRSGHWAAFWQTQPHAQPVVAPLCAASQQVASPPQSLPATPSTSASRLAPAGAPVVPAHAQTSPSSPHTRPKPTTRQRPLFLPRSA